MALTSRIVGIAGGAKGIGKAIGCKLLDGGAKKIYIADNNGCEGWKTEKEFKSKYGLNRVQFIETDVTNCESFDAFFKKSNACGGLDIFINAADVFEHPHVLDVNLSGVLRGLNLAHKYMGAQNGGLGGTVINLGCICSFIGFTALPRYTASKHAVIGITRVYAHKCWEKSKIKVMAVCPGLNTGDLYTRNLSCEMKELFKNEAIAMKLKCQSPVVVADCVVQALENNENGSIWICEENEIYMIDLPKVKEMERVVPEYCVPAKFATHIVQN